MLYGILNWGSAAKTNLEPLKRDLRKAVTVIDFAKYQAHSEPLFKKYNLLDFDNMYRVSHKKRPAFDSLLLPEYISNDILQYLIELLICSIIFRNFPGQHRSLRSDSVSDFLK